MSLSLLTVVMIHQRHEVSEADLAKARRRYWQASYVHNTADSRQQRLLLLQLSNLRTSRGDELRRTTHSLTLFSLALPSRSPIVLLGALKFKLIQRLTDHATLGSDPACTCALLSSSTFWFILAHRNHVVVSM